MKVIFHERFHEVYADDPAAEADRMAAIVTVLKNDFEFTQPNPADDEDLALVHTRDHIERLKRSRHVYEVGALSAGGAIMAAELAWKGDPAFGLIRPPGHHASPDSCWGFCYFNNMAIAIKKLLAEKRIGKALILDFDLHFGDGTENSFRANPEVVYFHPAGTNAADFIETVRKRFEHAAGFDILGVSAGFDRHVEDWGGLLSTPDYRTLGNLVKTSARRICQGRRFAVLEGGYNHDVLGQNVRAFLEGMSD